MPSAFKMYPAGEPAPLGQFGTSAFGTAPFGGNQQGTRYVLPPNEIGGDDTTRSLLRKIAQSVHRRDGRLLGARKYDEWGSWRFVFTLLSVADVEALLVFFQARRFKFIPDANEEETYIGAFWSDDTFAPESQRGPVYALSFEIEEV